MTFFKSIFSGRTVQNDSEQIISSDFIRQVQKSVQLLGDNTGALSDKEVVQILTNNGVGYNEAVEILLFLPIAFVRHWLPNLTWPETYIEFINDKTQIERKFNETKSFQIIWEVTKSYFQNSPNRDTIIKVGGRSAEFQAINKLLNDGGKLTDIQLTKTMIVR